MYKGVALYPSQDLPGKSALKKIIVNGKIPNHITDKNNEKERNLPSILKNVKSDHGRIIGVIDYYYQDRASKYSKFQDVYSTHAFILSPDNNILVVLGKGTHAPAIKNLLSELIDNTQNAVKYFKKLKIEPESMLRIAKKVRDSHKDNWCMRPRFSHEAQPYNDHVYNDYANGGTNCIFNTAEFTDEFPNCTGFSPVIKYHSCDMLDPQIDVKPKTMRLKHEGQISTSRSYDFENWDRFIFELVIPLLIDN